MLEEVNMPIDFTVNPSQVYSLSIPLKFSEHAQATANTGEEHHVATFRFFGPMGWKWGEEFKIKFKVEGEKQLNELEFYNLAMKIFEELDQSFPLGQITFETVVDILRNANGNG